MVARLFEREHELADGSFAGSKRTAANDVKKLASKYETAVQTLADVQAQAVQDADEQYRNAVLYHGRAMMCCYAKRKLVDEPEMIRRAAKASAPGPVQPGTGAGSSTDPVIVD